MRVWILGSGSAGNAVLIECGDSRVLVDAGFGTRTLAGRLRAIDVAPASIEACIVTHEHNDHVKGAAMGAKKWGWSLFASHGTVAACPELAAAGCTRVDAGKVVSLSRMTFTTALVPHDAVSPVAVKVTSSSSGATAVVCTDLGHVTTTVRALCSDADILVLESNHDEGMLRAGPYPPSVQARIGGRAGHLSNRASALLARDVVNRNLAHVVLAHLSEHCNDHGIAHGTMAGALRTTRFRGATSLGMQHGVVGPFVPRATRAEAPQQYMLAL